MKTLPCRADDVFVVTFPKAGTHWLNKICCLILDQQDFMFPPLEFNSWQHGPAFAGKGMSKGENGKHVYEAGPPWLTLKWDEMPSPRILCAHAPIEFLPEQCKVSRIVYVTRDVKDTCVSYLDFSNKNPMMEPQTMESCVRCFVAGGSFDHKANTQAGAVYGGMMYHVKGFMDASKNGYKIHFVNYDRMHLNPQKEITDLARFLDVEISPQQAADIQQKASFQSMKQTAADSEAAKGKGKGALGRMVLGEPLAWSGILYNKGVRGEGTARLTAEQVKSIDDAHAAAMKEVGSLFVQ
jgi:hypothetical protein